MTGRPHPQGGFVLLIVLAILAVLIILASSAALSSQQAVSDAQAEQTRFQSELDQLSTRETLLFMLTTNNQTLAGLGMNHIPPSGTEIIEDSRTWLPQGNEIRLDGRAYQGLGSTRFAIQDDRGLLSINWASPLFRQSLYQSLGAPAEQWAQLDDIRLDYQDSDSLRRLNGAETDETSQHNLPPPANRTLTSPLELRRLLEWRDLLAPLTDEELLGLLSVTRETTLNLNTAPAHILALIPGMTASEAERLVAMRQVAPIASIYQAQQTFPLPPDSDELLNLFANSSGNLILWDRQVGTKRLIHWTLTTLGNAEKPWRIDYEVTLSRGNQPDQPVAGAPETPLFSATSTSR